MWTIIAGIFLIAGGLTGTIVGMTQNNDLRAQISSLVSSGTANPGTVWLVIGLVAVVVGIALLAAGLMRRRRA
jgi:uncharacterized membrane protein YidH (DUF202 family)